jgi:hypothetical protein
MLKPPGPGLPSLLFLPPFFEGMAIKKLSISQGPIPGLWDAFISQERGRE